MSVAFPEIRVGDPVRHEGLAVFPLFTEPTHGVDYDLSDEAIGKGTATVEEVSESGSVPDLAVDNKGDVRVLFLEGEELIGAKQNRVLNISVLIAAHAKTPVPVSCVEQGRWGYRGRKFGSGSHSPHNLRHILKKSVNFAMMQDMGHRSDQGGVWEEVARQQRALGTSSGSGAMSDTFKDHEDRIKHFQDKLKPVKGAVGIAVALGGRIVCMDILDKPSTCEKVWSRLLSGFMLDALETPASDKQATKGDVEKILTGISGLPWRQTEKPVGEGEEHRAETPDSGVFASALTFDGNLIHGSVSVGT
jgi:hypothetical protein